jgi:hypothetical protein
MKKSLAILSMLVIVAALLALGCKGRNNANTPTSTPVPTVTGTIAPTATPTATVGADNTSSSYIDPSLADIGNESDESVPDEG